MGRSAAAAAEVWRRHLQSRQRSSKVALGFIEQGFRAEAAMQPSRPLVIAEGTHKQRLKEEATLLELKGCEV